MKLFLIIYFLIGIVYGGYVCGSTWESWGGGKVPILNGFFSAIFWPFILFWALFL